MPLTDRMVSLTWRGELLALDLAVTTQREFLEAMVTPMGPGGRVRERDVADMWPL